MTQGTALLTTATPLLTITQGVGTITLSTPGTGEYKLILSTTYPDVRAFILY